MSTYTRHNKVNELVDKKMKFDSNYSLASDHIKDPPPVVNFDPNKGNKVGVKYYYGLICLRGIGA